MFFSDLGPQYLDCSSPLGCLNAHAGASMDSLALECPVARARADLVQSCVLVSAAWVQARVLASAAWVQARVLASAAWVQAGVLASAAWVQARVLVSAAWVQARVLVSAAWVQNPSEPSAQTDACTGTRCSAAQEPMGTLCLAHAE